ncbi:MAG: DNA primase large subunit PriL [Candidatus Verstraetearchaeota archaeon]|nr:DNA primase large subunit PriL [Candidatus Verstraetearchaeota archaeon]
MLTKEDLAKYPFLKQTASFIENKGLDLSDLASDEYSPILARAIRRIRNSIEKYIEPTDISDLDAEILSYPLALALVYGSKSGWLVNRFATIEAKRTEEELRKEPSEKLIEIADSGFGWKVSKAELKLEWEEFGFSISFHNFLEAAPGFNSSQWKLVNRYLCGGQVFLGAGSLARLICEAFKMKILRRAADKEMLGFRLPEAFRPHLEEILEAAKEIRQDYEEIPRGLIADAMPPCITTIVNDVRAGKGLSHMARFTLTTFMVNVGEGVDDVLKLFGNVADFDEGKARYQIEHIAGMIGSKTKYRPPKCDVLRSFGLCVGADDLCREVKHPLTYYQKRLRATGRRGGSDGTRNRKKGV